jgi:hypothetical protein
VKSTPGSAARYVIDEVPISITGGSLKSKENRKKFVSPLIVTGDER